MKVYTKKLIFAFAFCLTLMSVNAQVTWTNGNGTNIWSDPGNWNTASVPVAGDDVIFDGTSTANCTIDMDIDINDLTITAAYTGIVDGTTGQNRIIQTNNFSLAGGTFIASDDTWNVVGNLTRTGGTFNNNGGLVIIFVTSGTTNTINGAFDFNDLTITHPLPVSGTAQRNVNFNSSSTTNFLNLSGSNRNYGYQGTITIFNDLNCFATGTGTFNPVGNTGVFLFSGAGPCQIVGNSTAGRNKIGNVTLNTTGSFAMSAQVSITGTWLNTQVGSFNPGSSTVNFFFGSCVVTGGTTATTRAYFDNINVQSGASLNVTAGSHVDLSGSLSHNGTYTGNTSLLRFTNNTSGAQAINGTAVLTSVNAMEKTGNGSLSFGHAIDLLDSIRISGGAVTGTNLTLKSTSALKARVAEISGGGSLGGTISVETFIPGGTTDWANLGASGVSGLTFNSWYGTIPMAIEGSATGVTSAGGQYFESVWRWDETSATGYDSTVVVTDPINVGQGYWIFVGTSLASSGNITTLVSGIPVTNGQTLVQTSSAQSGYCLVANPFPSPISWDRIVAHNGGKTSGAIYVYNADLGLTTSYAGGISTPGGPTSISSTIPMGQGFYTQSSGTGNLSVLESDKVSNNTSANPLLKTTAASIGSVIRLQVNGGGYMDETAIRFHSAATAGFDNNLDANKYFDSPGYIGYPGAYTKRTTISTKGGSADYSINSLPYATLTNAVIPVLVKVYTSGQHTISASGLSNLAPGTCVMLYDKVTSINHNLAASDYVFNINDTTSAARFDLTICANIAAGINNNAAVTDGNVAIKQDANGVYVQLNFDKNTKATITASNILGQSIMTAKEVQGTTEKYYLDLNNKDQVIIVNVTTNDKRYTQKIISVH